MTRKKDALPEASPKGQKGNCADRANDQTQPQYNHIPRFEQCQNNPEKYHRAVRRMMADAFVLAQDFPARLRFSYYVDRNSCLRCLTERRAVG